MRFEPPSCSVRESPSPDELGSNDSNPRFGYRVGGLVGLWLVVASLTLGSPGCYGRNCDGGVATFGSTPDEGRMIDENTWESSPIDGDWLDYPRARTYSLTIPELGGRMPEVIVPYLSAAKNPRATGANFTIGSGNLALLANASPNHIDVINDSCSDYFLRLVVIAKPFPPESTPDASASLLDAGADAGVDAGP